MNILLINTINGETVATSETGGLKPLRGCIRKWMKDGLHPCDMDIQTSIGHNALNQYLFDYAVDIWIDTEHAHDDDDFDDDFDDFDDFDDDFDDFDDDDDWEFYDDEYEKQNRDWELDE